ncbi:DUF3099 domain-containing protein [Agromyces sp. MMS24-K17]|uniref:DUF3099 domain-containing protein n=1 Tax=Agromyces sp. MMS24-K17 TaxID=3372850 RepID=UPI003754B965
MKQQYTITSLPPSPEAERKSRMVKYTITMSIRVLCIFCMLFARGWWLWIFAAGAIFLPYVAVVLANVGSSRGEQVAPPVGALPASPSTPTNPSEVPGRPDVTRASDAPGEASDRAPETAPTEEGDR